LKIGYIHWGDQGIQGREAFSRGESKGSILDHTPHHLYVCTSDNPEYRRHIRFRDTLRAEPLLREEYESIKYEILQRVGRNNRQGYVEMKERDSSEFFNRVLENSDKR